jgi:CheY-like chemotaxis protein
VATPTLLLADDSLTIRRVIELTFADQNIRVVTAGDGKEAIQKITTSPPDIILADVGMPEHDGYEVAAFVKKSANLSHIPVLLLAGAFEPVDHARARNVGCDGVLVKPFEPALVIARVRELLAGRDGAAPATTPREPANDSAEAKTSKSSEAPQGGGDYLDRLDAAFTEMSTSHRPFGTPITSAAEGVAARTGEGGWTPAVVTNSGQPVHQAGPASAAQTESAGSGYHGETSSPSLSDAFSALLAAERGTASSTGAALPPIALSDATIDEIARRVIARLGDEPMRQAVLDAAERLVREEIERIKKVQQQPPDRG